MFSTRWLLLGLVSCFLILPAGCICTNWRWIWEQEDDSCVCQYEPAPVQPMQYVGP
jgi:hypothetical protein